MLDIANFQHHVSVEELSKVLCNRTGKNDPKFFRILAVYYMGIIAASMRAKVISNDLKEIPINNYALALAPSGFGKGKSTGCLESEFMADFRTNFVDGVMPNRAEQNMWKLASIRAAVSGTEEQDEYDKMKAELNQCGEYPFVFDGASEPAIKQIRQMLLLSACGSINYQVDEIGSNLEKSGEALTTYLELYDQGTIKAKLTKNSHENKRNKEIVGKTPANMLLFGTPTKLLDGAQIERKFVSLLDTGYARRCLFAYGDLATAMDINLTAEEIYDRRVDPGNDAAIDIWRNHFASLADTSKLDWQIDVPRDVSIELITYQQWCAERARQFPEHHEVQKHEMEHRYFKVLKVAGTYAFIEETTTMDVSHIQAAIKLVEESGDAFNKLMNREAPYMKLARYIASENKELTHADLDVLPYYKGSQRDRLDLMTMAAAWGYKHHIMLKRSFVDGIEFFSGETLQETHMSNMLLSYSGDFAYDYQVEPAAFNDLHLLAQAPGLHWANHAFENGHRAEENVIPGFNMIVLDLDGGTSLDVVHQLLEGYTFMTYTTKRHTPENHRFRLILPMNYHLQLDKTDYDQFMKNVLDWLPFKTGVDKSANQRSRKWTSCETASIFYNRNQEEDVNLLDILPFVPKTSKNEQHQKTFTELASLSRLERWFMQHYAEGDRNNLMLKYALALVDNRMTYPEIESAVLAFNAKIDNGLPQKELRSTVLVTVAKKLQNQQAA